MLDSKEKGYSRGERDYSSSSSLLSHPIFNILNQKIKQRLSYRRQ